ncbi:hypothetical protein [Parenemella sanctibonifatiensis]|uniref:Uncharacterized protein n=1 Tax=Parenemella sanctibonifatiensis TaxID=2016505 RepID=A0A255EKG1_9ACTN|nr:hypothetical protein [Parenemella sanctibonifatiensis]OYN91984.1 hypothetical protein CGZ91_00155 [Parenemella sanctibonifatiensis]
MKKSLAKIALAAAMTTLTLPALTACTSTSYTCSDNACEISLSGDGASTTIQINNQDTEVTAVAYAEGHAEFTIGADSYSLDVNQSETGAGFEVTVLEATSDSMKIRIGGA